MALGDWIGGGVGLLLIVSWVTLQVKLATVAKGLKTIEDNHLPTLTRAQPLVPPRE